MFRLFSSSTSPAGANPTDCPKMLEEAKDNTRAVLQVMEAVSRAARVNDAIKTSLDTVKSVFGWAYASYWALEPSEKVLKFAVESGSVNEEFRRVTMEARFREGEGLSGRAWRQRDIFFTPDIGQMTDCCRAPVAQRAGVKSGVCFPVVVDGTVIGTMDFFSLEKIDLSKERLDALRGVGQLVSATVARLKDAERQAESAANAEAISRVLEAVQNGKTVDEAVRAALDTVRAAFGWAYGSYWKIDAKENALRFAVESGSVNEEFRRVTMEARFREGEGLSGRAWRNRDLFFTPDIGQMTDCCRAPVAQRAGVKSGVCFPIIVGGKIAGTMDFFATVTLQPTAERLESLRSVGRLVSSAIERVMRETENARTSSMMQSMGTSVTYADTDFVIRYVNPAAVAVLQKVEHLLPVKASQLVGQNIDIFHKEPERQRKILSNLKNLPAKARIVIGEEVFSLDVCAVYDQFQNHLGFFVAWMNITIAERNEKFIKDSVEEQKKKAEELQAKVDSLLVNMSAAAEGDLTQAVSVSGADAIGQLGEALTGFLASLRGSIQAIGSHATALASSSEEFSAVSTQMASNSEQTATQSNVVSAAAEEVSRNMQTVSAAIEEMGASIHEIAKNASEAAKISSSAVSVANGANATISKLGESSSEIGKVIKVITSIAEQTNLLALNATIEAARAGEAGKGFAVVANEVKELAKETAKATEDISCKIEAIQADSQEAVEAVQQISKIIGQMNDISNSIAGAVEEQTATTSEMARNIAEAAAGTNEIAQNITAVAQAAHSTTQGAANTQQAAGELSHMAGELQALVGQFNYDEPEVEEPPVRRPAANGHNGGKKSTPAKGRLARQPANGKLSAATK